MRKTYMHGPQARDMLEAELQQAVAAAESAVRLNVAERLHEVARRYFVGGHSHRAKMLHALAKEVESMTGEHITLEKHTEQAVATARQADRETIAALVEALETMNRLLEVQRRIGEYNTKNAQYHGRLGPYDFMNEIDVRERNKAQAALARGKEALK